MRRSIAAELAGAVDSEAPREERASAAAAIVRDGGAFRNVRIYDVGDEYIVLIGYAGSTDSSQQRLTVTAGPNADAATTRDTVLTGSEAVVPILGAESGVVIGTLDADGDRSRGISPEDVAFLEDCAALLRPLYD